MASYQELFFLRVVGPQLTKQDFFHFTSDQLYNNNIKEEVGFQEAVQICMGDIKIISW